MKQRTAVKFGLTLACAVVLAACSSSSSDNDEYIEREKTEEELKKVGEQEGELGKALQGHKIIKKSNSDLIIENTTGGAFDSSIAASMTEELFPRLDTVVVATPKAGAGVTTVAYLEDFDFTDAGAAANTSGNFTLENIYVKGEGTAPTTAQTVVYELEVDSSTGRPKLNADGTFIYKLDADGNRIPISTTGTLIPIDPTSEVYANVTTSTRFGQARAGGRTATKTDTQGDAEGTVRLYQDGLKIYIEASQIADLDVVDKANQGITFQDNNVAEVYGHRTFAQGETGDKALNNLPLVNNYRGAQLTHVQYGRVTSAISGSQEDITDQYKKGVLPNSYVVNYGYYGNPGTEDHYFYRGVGTTDDISGLTTNNADGVIHYAGHAVTYGLDNTVNPDTGKAANAIGDGWALLSGTHADARINLGTKAVDGELYNVWQSLVNNANTQNVNLVTFEGTLAGNGDISGTSALAYSTNLDNASGTFNATLYGTNAQELGGAVVSNNKAAGSDWGAVFGAIRAAEEVPYTPTPVTPTNPWGGASEEGRGN